MTRGASDRVQVVHGSPDGVIHVWTDPMGARLHYTALIGAGLDAELYGIRRESWDRIHRDLPDYPVVEHPPVTPEAQP